MCQVNKVDFVPLLQANHGWLAHLTNAAGIRYPPTFMCFALQRGIRFCPLPVPAIPRTKEPHPMQDPALTDPNSIRLPISCITKHFSYLHLVSIINTDTAKCNTYFISPQESVPTAQSPGYHAFLYIIAGFALPISSANQTSTMTANLDQTKNIFAYLHNGRRVILIL